MADPVVFHTNDHGARNRDNWNELSQRVQSAIDGVGNAEQAALDAQGAASRAEAATNIYPDEPTGRAAVGDGQVFRVAGNGDVAAYEYRRTSASASELVA